MSAQSALGRLTFFSPRFEIEGGELVREIDDSVALAKNLHPCRPVQGFVGFRTTQSIVWALKVREFRLGLPL